MRFAFRRDLALGRYVALDTPIHRLDPRAKLIAFFGALFALFASSPSVCLASTLALAGVCGLCRIPPRFLVSNLRSLAWVFAITFAYQALWAGPRLLGGVGEGAEVGLHMVVRLVGMVLAVAILMFTTEPLRLADGLASLFGFLERVRVPVRDLALVLTLALRFLPTVLEEAERIVTAQRARGARFEGNLLARARSLLPLAVPLLASCLRRADTLALAMTARGYRPGAPRTSMEPLAFGARDLGVVLGAAALVAVTFAERFARG
jgi:energy-coupling factor transport system permease protein